MATLGCSDPELAATARLVVSELVTNVVVHAHTHAELDVSVRDGRLRIEVTDASLDPVRHFSRPIDAIDGRGLRIVDALSADWGVVEFGGGKIVWSELVLPTSFRHRAGARLPGIEREQTLVNAQVRE